MRILLLFQDLKSVLFSNKLESLQFKYSVDVSQQVNPQAKLQVLLLARHNSSKFCSPVKTSQSSTNTYQKRTWLAIVVLLRVYSHKWEFQIITTSRKSSRKFREEEELKDQGLLLAELALWAEELSTLWLLKVGIMIGLKSDVVCWLFIFC